MQNLRQRAIFGRKNSGRKVLVVQKLLPMQHMQQNSKVSCFVVIDTFQKLIMKRLLTMKDHSIQLLLL